MATVVLPMVATLLLACGDSAPDAATDDTAPGGTAGASGAPDTAGGLAGPQAEFWANLQTLCGNAYEGRIMDAQEMDTTFTGRRLVMHVRECTDDEVRIPFHVGENRSRTWIISRTGDGLRLKHDHRHEDGSDDEITMYGGDTVDRGTATRQEFPADEYTADLVPVARTNVWTVEVMPGHHYAYALRREGTDRRLRVEFDLTRTVSAPPAPWGWE
ncbi:MAG TPA: hypothetical protein VK929_05765 [Longimicrobiales bacterium]|nr:hypothetical protein [Longimicrobiales bacterium]